MDQSLAVMLWQLCYGKSVLQYWSQTVEVDHDEEIDRISYLELLGNSYPYLISGFLNYGITLALFPGLTSLGNNKLPVKWSYLSFKMGLPRPLFVYFCSFQTQILQKNCRHQRDLISNRQSRRRVRWPLDHHHCPMELLNSLNWSIVLN